MKSTKDRILDTALVLFNTSGLAKVSLRTIANKMGISQGNLNYHYKKREDIITSLYFQLVENINDNMPPLSPKTPQTLKLLFHISEAIMDNFFDYRFFLLDFVQIIRENEKIKTHYKELSQIREQQFAGIFNQMIDNGVMRAEKLPNEYHFLYKRFQILGDFWLSSAATTQQPISKKRITEYAQIINQMIYPYLTKKGQKEFLLLTQKN